MKNLRNGSMILTCMFFISVCMMIMVLQWRSQEAIETTMIMRVRMAKNQYACEALMEYGIHLCKQQYALLRKKISNSGRPLIVSFERWPLGDEQYGQGIVEISYNKQFTIMASLRQNQRTMVTISCSLEREKNAQNQAVVSVFAWKQHHSTS